MKKHKQWNYSPYRPLFVDVGDIYICRLAPDFDSLHLEWLSIGDVEYSIYYSVRNQNDFKLAGTTKDTEFTITNLVFKICCFSVLSVFIFVNDNTIFL